MNGGTQGELLHLNIGHPIRTNIDEKNYKAIAYIQHINTKEDQIKNVHILTYIPPKRERLEVSCDV